MPFGVISTLYFPFAANAGSSLWGTDVRKVVDTPVTGNEQTTSMNHGTGSPATLTTRTADPYTAGTATDGVEANFGWAIDPADMGSTADFVRSYVAGNHVATARLLQSGSGNVNVTLTMFVFKVGSAAGGRVRTLLGSASATVNVVGLNLSAATFTVSASLPAVVFGPDETIQYSFETAAGGEAVTGRSVTWRVGDADGVSVRMTTPPLKITAATAGASTGVGSASGSASAVAGTVGASTGVGVATGVPTAISSSTGSAVASASAAGALGASAGFVGASASVASTSGSLGASAGLVGSAVSTSTALGSLSAQAGTVGSAAGTSTALGAPSAVAGTTGSAEGASSVSGALSVLLATTGTSTSGGGGGDTFVRPIFVFDD